MKRYLQLIRKKENLSLPLLITFFFAGYLVATILFAIFGHAIKLAWYRLFV